MTIEIVLTRDEAVEVEAALERRLAELRGVSVRDHSHRARWQLSVRDVERALAKVRAP